MFSRTCLTSQFREYSRSFQSTKRIIRLKHTHICKLSATNSSASGEVESKYRFYNGISKKWNKYLKDNIKAATATGLLLHSDNVSQAKTENIADTANDTVTQLFEKNTIPSEILPSDEVKSLINNEIAETETSVKSQVIPEDISLVDSIPQPPPIPDFPVGEVIEQLNALGQPTFASLGLGGSTPVGLVQTCFEFFNVSLGIPWWGTIVIGTIIIRICMFPLVIIAQRNAAKMNNNLPGLQVIQLKVTEARQTGNQLDVARYSQEMMMFMKEKDLNPLKNMIVPLAQMPIFISFFMGLRQMANVPVESLKTGGLWWFTDLTLPDQYFIMPVVTSLTLWATIELGTDGAKLSSQNLQLMKYVLRGLPLCILPFTVNFPGAILVYWTSSNFISLAQVGFLKLPRVREYFKIEKQIHIDPQSLPVKPKGFTEGIKDSWTNIKIVRELEERRQLDEMQFKRAGKGPIVKTYSYDPTKPINPPVSAKKR